MVKSIIFLFVINCVSFSFVYSQEIIINEFLASNSESVHDEDDDDSDWIEIYNKTDNDINLKGYRILNKNDYSAAWQFPDVILHAKSHHLIFASGKNRTSSDKFIIESYGAGITGWNDIDQFRFHYKEIEGDFEISIRINSIRNSFDYSTAGLILRDNLTDNSRYAGIFALTEKWFGFWLQQRLEEGKYPKLYWVFGRENDYPDVSMKLARRGDSIYTYTWMEDYFWKPTQNVLYHPAPKKVYIGLALSSSEQDKSTLFAVSELKLNDDSASLEDFSVIEFQTSKDGSFSKSNELHTNFVLNKEQGEIYLWNDSGVLIDSVRYYKQYSDISFGRCSESGSEFKYLNPPTPLSANSQCFERRCAEPMLNKVGWYNNNIIVNFINNEPGSRIYFTMDGSTPTEASAKYNGNGLNITRTTPMRAVAIKDGFLPSTVFSTTIFINDSSSLPVVSLVSDSVNFWDKDYGIFSEKNYWIKLEIPAHFDYFSSDNKLIYSSHAGCRLYGKSSKYYDQKSMSLYARNKYALDNFNYNFFYDSDIGNPQRLILRNSGTDWPFTMMRDGFLSCVLMQLDHLNLRSYQPASVFINGNYWGILNLRDKIDEKYLSKKYNIPSDSINLMEDPGNWGRLQNGSSKSYHKLLDTLFKLDMTLDVSYEIVGNFLDYDNFIDYSIAEIHCVNLDWPSNNIKLWHSEDYDGKWRWILNDLDFSYGLLNAKADVFMYNIAFETECDYSKIASKLLDNNKFKFKFINRTADLLNSIFLPENVISILDSLSEQIAPEIPRHQVKWDSSAKNWQNHIQDMKDFAQKRPFEHRRYTRWYFNLSNDFQITLKINDNSAGKIQISTLNINRFPWQGRYFTDVPLPVRAIPNDGYKFVRWSGDKFKDSSASMIIYLDSDLELEAQFIKDGNYTSSLVINEIMYRAAPAYDCKDWFELYNNSDANVFISGFWFSDDNDSHQFYFKDEISIPGNGFLVVCQDTTVFKTIYKNINNIIGNFDFGIGTSDKIRIFNNKGELLDLVNYSSELPWPQGADGTGKTIELINPNRDNNIYWNWNVSDSLGGTPGSLNSVYTSIVDYVESNDKLNCYPNPTSDYFYLLINFHSEELPLEKGYFITGSISARISIVLYNSMGTKFNVSTSLHLIKDNQIIYRINCKGLPDGMYYCIVNFDSQINSNYIIPVVIN